MNTIQSILQQIKESPSTIQFADVIAVVDQYYDFTPTSFTNGHVKNEAGQNSGSCKIFSFAKLHGLSQDETLACFGDYYRVDVLQHPSNTDHQNIRNFIEFGWNGIVFEDNALRLRV